MIRVRHVRPRKPAVQKNDERERFADLAAPIVDDFCFYDVDARATSELR